MTPELQAEIDDLIAEFDLLDDWEQRYRYVIDLGKALPDLQDFEKTDDNKVKGCVSQVWLISEPHPKIPSKLQFRAQSDAHIVRGLAALLIRLYSGKDAREIEQIDARAVLGEIGLSEHLSPQRSNGLNSMISRIRADAASAS